MRRTSWSHLQLAADLHVLELDARHTPAGCQIELEVYDGMGHAQTYAVWRLTENGRVLAVLRASEA